VIGDASNATSAVLVVLSPLSAGLLLIAGTVKVARPEPTARALYAAGISPRSGVARGIGSVEMAVGTAALVRPGPATELALAITYLSFAAFVGFLLIARPGAVSCGCAGAKDVPPSPTHVVLNVVAAGTALAAAIAPPPGLGRMVASFGWASVPFAIGLVGAGVLVTALVSDVPAAFRSYRPPSRHPLERDPDRHVRADLALTSAGIGPGHPSLWPDAVSGAADD
jgi:hypothetical protein